MNSIDPGSFRDPGGRVFERDGRIFRSLNDDGLVTWNQLNSSGLLEKLLAKSYVVKTWQPTDQQAFAASSIELEHEKIPFVSYAYEWPFALLKKAAQLHLVLLNDILQSGFILKDATPFNVQFVGTRPLFIDVLSIERRAPGDAWAGYGQFCDTMLYPLMLQAYCGIDYQPWLRGELNGLKPETMSRLIPWRMVFRKGVLWDVKLRASLHARVTNPEQIQRSHIQEAQLPIEVVQKNCKRLQDVIDSLTPRRPRAGVWLRYSDDNSYSSEARTRKEAFVEKILSSTAPKTVLDLGCNTGQFSFLAARTARQVVAIDQDEAVVDELARKTDAFGVSNILPLVQDLANPSPGLGWAGGERRSFFDRGPFDLLLALAIGHHLAIRNNIPLSAQMALFAKLVPTVIFEFVDRTDPMTKRLMMNTGIDHKEYSRDEFLRAAHLHFSVQESVRLSESREIFALQRKP